MQAHALTPLMLAHSSQSKMCKEDIPTYPFLTLLASGKHTMLVYTKSAVNHRILVSTTNPGVALGDFLDKFARDVLPSKEIPKAAKTVVYPRLMEKFVGEQRMEDYSAPETDEHERSVFQSEHGWEIPPPLLVRRKKMEFSFSDLNGRLQRILTERPDMPDKERQDLAYHVMRIAFEHLMSRVLLALKTDEDLLRQPPKHLVMSGGVTSNLFLRKVARSTLQARGFPDVRVVVPDPEWCTDNAAMIAYAGAVMYEEGWESDNAFAPQSKWSIEDIFAGVDCWSRRPNFPPATKVTGMDAATERGHRSSAGPESQMMPMEDEDEESVGRTADAMGNDAAKAKEQPPFNLAPDEQRVNSAIGWHKDIHKRREKQRKGIDCAVEPVQRGPAARSNLDHWGRLSPLKEAAQGIPSPPLASNSSSLHEERKEGGSFRAVAAHCNGGARAILNQTPDPAAQRDVPPTPGDVREPPQALMNNSSRAEDVPFPLPEEPSEGSTADDIPLPAIRDIQSEKELRVMLPESNQEVVGPSRTMHTGEAIVEQTEQLEGEHAAYSADAVVVPTPVARPPPEADQTPRRTKLAERNRRQRVKRQREKQQARLISEDQQRRERDVDHTPSSELSKLDKAVSPQGRQKELRPIVGGQDKPTSESAQREVARLLGMLDELSPRSGSQSQSGSRTFHQKLSSMIVALEDFVGKRK